MEFILMNTSFCTEHPLPFWEHHLGTSDRQGIGPAGPSSLGFLLRLQWNQQQIDQLIPCCAFWHVALFHLTALFECQTDIMKPFPDKMQRGICDSSKGMGVKRATSSSHFTFKCSPSSIQLFSFFCKINTYEALLEKECSIRVFNT